MTDFWLEQTAPKRFTVGGRSYQVGWWVWRNVQAAIEALGADTVLAFLNAGYRTYQRRALSRLLANEPNADSERIAVTIRDVRPGRRQSSNGRRPSLLARVKALSEEQKAILAQVLDKLEGR